MMNDSAAPVFPCKTLPDDPAQAKLLGIYPQRDGGLYMQRVKVPLGSIRPGQLRALAAVAGRYTPDDPLHLTTRQDIELHGLLPEDVPAVQRGIHAAGLTSLATCGDSVRNIAVCPGNGFHAGTWDVAGTASSIQRFAESLPWVRSLPRKFKISVSGCPKGCARPWINDLGLVANADGSFRAVVAGSLGARPGLGLLLCEALPPGEILPLVGAVLKLFHAEGDRQRRTRARLRHLRERLGDEAFRDRLEALLRQEKQAGSWPEPRLRRVERETPLQARLALPLGDVAAGAAFELADAVEAAGAELRLGLQHDLLVYGNRPLRLSPSLDALTRRPAVVACPGAALCSRGLADSRSAAASVAAKLPDDCNLSVAVAGCPNNCPHAAVADIGLVGCVKRIGGRRRECFRLLVGGGNGQHPVLAQLRQEAVPADQVDQAVAQVVEELLARRQPLPTDRDVVLTS